MSYWWVNQGGSYEEEHRMGCIFASKISPGGLRLKHHWAVKDVRPADIVLHNVNSRLVAVSVVKKMPEEVIRPYERPNYPQTPGFLASVEYHTLDNPIKGEEIPVKWRAQEAERQVAQHKQSPFARDGHVREAYLTPISDEFIKDLVSRFGHQLPDIILDNLATVQPAIGRSSGTDAV